MSASPLIATEKTTFREVRFGSTSDETLDVRDIWNPAGSRHGGGWLLWVLTLVGDVIPSDARNL
jgi:hypothetical protein